MDNLKEAVTRARLGEEQYAKLVKSIEPMGRKISEFWLDPADPRVYEAVIKLAIEKNVERFTDEMVKAIDGTWGKSFIRDDGVKIYCYLESSDVLSLVEATPEQRLRAALKVLE